MFFRPLVIDVFLTFELCSPMFFSSFGHRCFFDPCHTQTTSFYFIWPSLQSREYAFICTDKVLHMLIRLAFSNPFDWYIITIYKYSFSDNILSKYFWTIYVIVSKNLEKYAFFNKIRFFPKRNNWQLGKYLIYIQQMKLYRMCDSNFPHVHFYFFRFFSSNGTIRAQLTHICFLFRIKYYFHTHPSHPHPS
jgi:hypothetical protein